MSASAEQDTSRRLPDPPSQDVINLAGADIAISSVLLLFSAWIAWKHGKQGMVAWPIFASCFVARLVAAAYLIAKRDEPEIPGTVTVFTGSCVLACISLTIVGVIYECNIILPTPAKRKREKIMLGFLHLTNTLGLAIAMYGGSPKDSPSGVINPTMNKIGNVLLLQTLAVAYAWMVPTYRKIQRHARLDHPNATAAQHMFWATFFAMAFWVVRIAYHAVYAFHRDAATLDPVMGGFLTKLVLVFGTWLAASVPLAVAGWLGRNKLPRAPGVGAQQLSYLDPETALRMERRRTLGELRREHERWRSEVPAGVSDAEPLHVPMLDVPGPREKSRFQVMKKKVSQTFSVSSRD